MQLLPLLSRVLACPKCSSVRQLCPSGNLCTFARRSAQDTSFKRALPTGPFPPLRTGHIVVRQQSMLSSPQIQRVGTLRPGFSLPVLCHLGSSPFTLGPGSFVPRSRVVGSNLLHLRKLASHPNNNGNHSNSSGSGANGNSDRNSHSHDSWTGGGCNHHGHARRTTCHASSAFSESHSHSQDETASSCCNKSDQHHHHDQRHQLGTSHSHSHSHPHHHGHHHHHHHPHSHHHHYHSDSSNVSSNPVIASLEKLGFFQLSEHLEHNTTYTVASVSCFIATLLLPYLVSSALVPAAIAATLAKLALTTTFILSGVPQVAETLLAFAARKVDTHVLMSLSVLGTLYMGMAQEGALLLLLFRVSHLLEDKLTAKAAGSLERLFDSVPSRATLVQLDEAGAPKPSTATEVSASHVKSGSLVLVRPGEQVPLDGDIVWGTSSVSLQHISGESLPVRLGVGAEVPAGSLSMDGLLVLKVKASSEDSTPARMARMAAEAQAQRPQLTRWLDRVGEVWSMAVIGATLATAVVLPLLGIPFWGDRGALYRAMGVLTAGSPCALALVPLAYACAIAAITMKGVLIKSGAALDALHKCSAVALDKTGTITTGSLSLADGYVLTVPGVDFRHGTSSSSSSTSSSSSSTSAARLADALQVRAMKQQEQWQQNAGISSKLLPSPASPPSASSAARRGAEAVGSSSNEGWWLGETTGRRAGTGVVAAVPLYPADVAGYDETVVKYAVALSRLSNHPVSRAMVESEAAEDGDVSVISFEQVPGAGVEGVCQIGNQPQVQVRFGALDWIAGFLPATPDLAAALHLRFSEDQARPSRAVAFIHVSPAAASAASASTSTCDAAPAGGAAAAAAGGIGSDDSSAAAPAAAEVGGSRSGTPTGRAVGDAIFFSYDDLLLPVEDIVDRTSGIHPGSTTGLTAVSTEAAAAAAAGGGIEDVSSSTSSRVEDGTGSSMTSSSAAPAAAEGGDGGGGGEQLAMLCFEDVIQGGVPGAVHQLQSGGWGSSWWGSGRDQGLKEVIMLTGDNNKVAQAVAKAVGIQQYKAGLKPEDKLSYVQQATVQVGQEEGMGGLLMAGDGINDAPALAASSVGVAIASTPSDMVAAAADIIILNGQGVTNLPWLFQIADRTQAILRQNLTLALVSVVLATLPTLAGLFPLWLAVTLHEGSTLLVALNSLRLLLDAPSAPSAVGGAAGGGRMAGEHGASSGNAGGMREGSKKGLSGHGEGRSAMGAAGGTGVGYGQEHGEDAGDHQHQHDHQSCNQQLQADGSTDKGWRQNNEELTAAAAAGGGGGGVDGVKRGAWGSGTTAAAAGSGCSCSHHHGHQHSHGDHRHAGHGHSHVTRRAHYPTGSPSKPHSH